MRTQTSYDPFRAAQRGIRLPGLGDLPYAGPVTVLAHVDRYPPWVNAGAERMLHALLTHLVERGHEVHVTTAVDEPAVVDGVHVWPAAHARTLAAGADVIVGHLLWTREAVTLARQADRPLLYLVHNDFQVRYWRLQPSDVTVLVHNAEWVEDRHYAQAPWWGGPTEVIRPPCRIRDYRVDRPDPRYVTLINPNPDKGAATFYEIARRMPDREFLVVGGGYGQQVPVPPDLPNVTYQPPTPRIAEDVYARTRVLLVPSRYESWGRVAVEAMCSGIPVVAHPTAGLIESCGTAGIFADRADPAAWVDVILGLDDPATYQERSSRALERALLLDQAAQRDLASWERLVGRAAAPVVASRT